MLKSHPTLHDVLTWTIAATLALGLSLPVLAQDQAAPAAPSAGDAPAKTAASSSEDSGGTGNSGASGGSGGGDDALPPPATEAEVWLDRIEAAGRKIGRLDARLRYELVQGAMGDKQIRAGSLFYDSTPPVKFAVHFDRLLAGRRLIREDRWYIFDGQWLVEKIVDQKQFIKRQIVDPDASPQDTTHPLSDGGGPFALPLTLSRRAVVKKYQVTLIDPQSDKQTSQAADGSTHSAAGQKNTTSADAQDASPAAPTLIHLRLIPHVARRGEFTQIDLWYDKTTLLPTKAQTLDETENETTVILSAVRQVESLDAGLFDTTPPQANEGWTIEIKPWQSAAAPTAPASER